MNRRDATPSESPRSARMRSLLCMLSCLLAVGLTTGPAAAATVPSAPADEKPRFWIFLAERPAIDTSSTTGSIHARKRRARRGTSSASRLTRPVASRYVDALRERGVEPVVRSRWLHAVSAPLTPEQRTRVARLSFVQHVQPVARGTVTRPEGGARREGLTSPVLESSPQASAADSAFYGASYGQLAFMNALAPLERNLNGRGVRIGFMDTGFRDLQHPTFAKLRRENRLLGLRDFTEGHQTNNHGAGVVSAAVGHTPGTLIGPAHEAEVLGASTEFTQFERNVEEDYFVAGLEWLERQGVDLVNVSLGYTTFDEGEHSYTTEDLDGNTAVTTRAVDAAAQLGVIVVVAAGNSSCESPSQCWYHVSTPADADSAITVGAVAPDSSFLSFSGRGPTADGRTKPDVVALGRSVTSAWGTDGYAGAGGTSFAAPLVTGVVAQMLQINPDLGPMDVRSILRRTASEAQTPTPTTGWGLINADAAVRAAERMARASPPSATLIRPPSPNPATNRTSFTLRAPAQAEHATISLYDLLGRRVLQRTVPLQPGPNRLSLNLDGLPTGMYLYRLRTADHLSTGKLVVVQ